ncbi:MAG TPA: acyl-CoA dehydrogenase family protein [Stellaceae bacterium]|jgi:3-hydroxy-9,10-secoandrosta-1,3,5(10)-triene-9,17-dione monooxygenase|nr:acyl-CoA dehydrogenase family protein [Stellaceae bacterium]
MTQPIPSADELVARAAAMVPTLRQRAAATEAQRRIGKDSAQEFRAAGFFRVLQPKRFGGYEVPFGTHMRIAAELGRGCASSAWVASVIAVHSWIVGMFPAEAQDEVWGDDHGALVATSFLPAGAKTERVGNGIVLSGRWKFSSGLDLCQWAIPLIDLPPREAGGKSELGLALIPLSDCKAEDTWYTSGLAGTGSNDFLAESLFVPEHRVIAVSALKGGDTPGSAANPSPFYRLPLWTFFPFALIGAGLGAAKGALEQIVDGLANRKSIAQVKIAEQQSVQLRIARATAQINAAEALLLQDLQAVNRDAAAGAIPDLPQRLRYRLDLSYAIELCVSAVDTLYPLLGGRGLVSTDPVQRAWRDVHAVSQHIALVWDVTAGLYGAVRLGFPCADPKI